MTDGIPRNEADILHDEVRELSEAVKVLAESITRLRNELPNYVTTTDLDEARRAVKRARLRSLAAVILITLAMAATGFVSNRLALNESKAEICSQINLTREVLRGVVSDPAYTSPSATDDAAGIDAALRRAAVRKHVLERLAPVDCKKL